jgi:hypothetical protein
MKFKDVQEFGKQFNVVVERQDYRDGDNRYAYSLYSNDLSIEAPARNLNECMQIIVEEFSNV